MINCEICNARVHAIRKHLNTDHTEWDIARYLSEFPEAPLFSEEAEKAIESARRKNEAAAAEIKMAGSAARKIEPLSEEIEGGIRIQKKAMHEIFHLGEVKAARSARRNTPIPITCLEGVKEPALIPSFDKGYVFNIDTLKTLLMGIELNIPTYIYGHAGLGKSTLWEQIAAATGRPMRRVQHTVNTEESHIVGQYVVNHVTDPSTGELKAKTEFQLGDLPLAMMNGEIFLADEYDRCYPSVLSVYQAVLEGKALHIKDAPPEYRLIKPHPQFRFVATGNTNGAGDDTGLYQATVVQDAATFERFGIVERVDYMPEAEETKILKAKTNIINEDAARLIKFANTIRTKSFPTEVSLTIGPRVLLNIARLGIARSNYYKGVEVAYANRLPEAERKAALGIAQRILAD